MPWKRAAPRSGSTPRAVCGVGVLALVAAVLCVPAAEPGLTFGSARRLTDCGAGRPVWSADSARVYYLADSDQSLWSVDVGSGECGKVVPGPLGEPALSPDGRLLAYLSGRSVLRRTLVVRDLLTGKQRPATATPGFYSDPVWLDGSRLAYRVRDSRGTRRMALDVKSGEVRDSPSLPDGRWVFSRDGRAVAVVSALPGGARRTRVFSAAGELLAEMGEAAPERGGGGGGCSDPSFSPDGRFLAYTFSRLQPNADVYVHDLRTGTGTRLTRDGASNRLPAWSPDGKSIAYESMRSGNREIWLVPVVIGAPAAERPTIQRP